jgi:hypothetical protein
MDVILSCLTFQQSLDLEFLLSDTGSFVPMNFSEMNAAV